jgi:hypothetical protein
MSVRDLVPRLMLRLHKDQEAYDFMKRYRMVAENGNHDWDDMDAPFLLSRTLMPSSL